MVTLVEGFLKEFQNEGQINRMDKGQNNVDLTSTADDELPPDEISVSLCKLGGHVDLMPVWFHFLSREAIYIVAFDLEKDLMDQISRQEWDSLHKEWIEVKDEYYTNLDVLIGWINTIHHKTRCSKNPQKVQFGFSTKIS